MVEKLKVVVNIKTGLVEKVERVVSCSGTRAPEAKTIAFLNNLFVVEGKDAWFTDLCAARNDGSLSEETTNKQLNLKLGKE